LSNCKKIYADETEVANERKGVIDVFSDEISNNNAHINHFSRIINERYRIWSQHVFPPGPPITVPKALAGVVSRPDVLDLKEVTKPFAELVEVAKDEESADILLKRHYTPGTERTRQYAEGLSGEQNYYNAIYSSLIQGDVSSMRMLLNIYESALLKIAVFDERIIRYCKKNPAIHDRLRTMGICVIDSIKWNSHFYEYTEGGETLGNDVRTELIRIRSLGESQLAPLHDIPIFIIHQGVIDKLKFDGNEESKAFVKCMYHSGKVRWAFVTTGRGEPANIPEYARRIPFSSVESALMKSYPEKILLMQTLMKAKAKKNA
jgi:hypothetical protein